MAIFRRAQRDAADKRARAAYTAAEARATALMRHFWVALWVLCLLFAVAALVGWP